MITFRMLGGVGLTDSDGGDVDGLLRQPKRLALLAYLAMPKPGTWHRRETIAGVFWSESDPNQARTALRNALYVIRQEVGADVVRSRGDEEISLDPATITTDITLLHDDLAADRLVTALERHDGGLLPGFYLSDTPAFEQWLEGERRRLRSGIIRAAEQEVPRREQAGDMAGAIELQQQLFQLDPDDEVAARRLMTLCDHAGDHARALAVFDRLQSRLRAEFAAEPSAETVRVAEEIRNRRAPRRELAPSPAQPVELAPDDPLPAPPAHAAPPVALPQPLRRRSRLRVAALGVVVVVAALFVSWRAMLAHDRAVVGVLLVLPMQNTTGDSSSDYIASGLGEEIAARLSGMNAMTVRSAARATWPASTRDSLRQVGARFGATTLLASRLSRVGDSLQVEAWTVDAAQGDTTHRIPALRFSTETLRDAGSHLAANIAGTLYRAPIPEFPTRPTRQLDAESYRLTLAGWQELLGGSNLESARRLFTQATDRDRSNARAWSGLSSALSASVVNGRVPFDEGYPRAERAARTALALDSTQGTAWADLGILEAMNRRSLAAGEPFLKKAVSVEPSNPEIYMIYGTALRLAWQWDRTRDQVRLARQLDPLASIYAGREANSALCADRNDEALQLYQTQIYLDENDREGQLGAAIALGRLGRWDEAIAQLHRLALSRNDTLLAEATTHAHGESGYWEMKHLEGRQFLASRQLLAAKGYLSTYVLGVAEIGAGQIDQGFVDLEAALRQQDRLVYKLKCNPEVDEVRNTPRFKRLLELAGPLPK